MNVLYFSPLDFLAISRTLGSTVNKRGSAWDRIHSNTPRRTAKCVDPQPRGGQSRGHVAVQIFFHTLTVTSNLLPRTWLLLVPGKALAELYKLG